MQKYIIIAISVLAGVFVGSIDVKWDFLDKQCSMSTDDEPRPLYLAEKFICYLYNSNDYKGVLHPLDMSPRTKDTLIVILAMLAAMGCFSSGYFFAKLQDLYADKGTHIETETEPEEGLPEEEPDFI